MLSLINKETRYAIIIEVQANSKPNKASMAGYSLLKLCFLSLQSLSMKK